MSPALIAQTDLGWLESTFIRLFDAGPLGPLAAAGAILAALGIGAAHALAPGHGKAVVAAYLVGERGRPRDAVALGVVVSLMHTFSVLVVALSLVAVTRAGAAAGGLATIGDIGPWMTLAAGVIVAGVGAWLLVRQLRRRRAGRHHHGGGHRHHHPPEGASPLSRKGLVLLGMSGGLLPSPSAFLVLTTGLFTGRTGFALVLVAAFSVGLAATLTAIGLAVLLGRDRLVDRLTPGGRVARLTGALPLVSALAVLLLGVGTTGMALLRL